MLATGAVLSSPAAAFAQSAGDQQYADPLGSDTGQTTKGKSDSGSKGTSDTKAQSNGQLADSGSSATPTPTPQAATANDGTQSGKLPRTGLDPIMFVVTGAVLLLSGVVIHRLASTPAVRLR